MIDERALEAACRAYCLHLAVDPDELVGGGIPRWKYTAPAATKIVLAYEAALWRPIAERVPDSPDVLVSSGGSALQWFATMGKPPDGFTMFRPMPPGPGQEP